jgi:hypothetical protein
MLWKVSLRPRTKKSTPPVFPVHFWAHGYFPSQHAASELEVLVTYSKCVRQFPIQCVVRQFFGLDKKSEPGRERIGMGNC